MTQPSVLDDSELDLDHATGLMRADGAAGGVGKLPATARLTPPANITIFRVADRESARALGESLRDRNGVAPGAATSVDRAAGSSGTPLPEELRHRFESCLDVDLSGVSVHTGSESHEAARAVGAKAYTQGQDIHFGAGHYDPSGVDGQRLLAHEVAHTVQQRGASTVATQYKLDVSTPGDAYEHEADHAADAIMAGSPFQIFGAISGIQREADPQVEVDNRGMSDFVADDVKNAERNARTYQASAEYKPGASLTNKYAQKEAGDRLKLLQSQTAELEYEATNSGGGWDKVEHNHAAINTLQEYVNTRNEEGSDLSALLSSNRVLQQDFARLNAAVASVQKSLGISNDSLKKMATPENPIDHTKELNATGQTGQKLGNAIGNDLVGGDGTGKGAKAAELKALVTTAQGNYTGAVSDVNALSSEMKSKASGLTVATAALTMFNLKQDGKEIAGKLQAAQAEAAQVRDIVSTTTGLITSCIGLSGGLATAVTEGLTANPSAKPLLEAIGGGEKFGGAAPAAINDLISKVLTGALGIDKRISNLTAALNINELQQLQQEKTIQGAAVTAAAKALESVVTRFKDAVAKVDATKRALRTAMTDYGARLDDEAKKAGTGSGDRFKVVGQLMGECDAFLGQASIVYRNAQEYRGSAARAKDSRNDINTKVTGGNALKYGMAVYYLTRVPAEGRLYILMNVENIHLHMAGSETDGSQTPGQAVGQVESDVKQAGSMAFGMRNQLAGFMGLEINATVPDFMAS